NFASFILRLSKSPWWYRGIFVTIIWAILYLSAITTVEISKKDTRRIYPAMKMLETGNYFIPEYMGESYYKKPPMFNWLLAFSIRCFGANDFAVRLPARVSILSLSLLIAFMPSGFLDNRKRLISSIVIMSCLGILDIGRAVEIDACYVAVSGAAIVIWLNFFSSGKKGICLWLLPGFFVGIGFLLKGPLILLFYYLPVIFVLKKNKRLFELFSFSHILSIFVAFGIFYLWYFNASHEKIASSASEMSNTWRDEILYRLNPLNINFKKWILAVFGAVFSFMPWLLFLPEGIKILRKKGMMDEAQILSNVKMGLFANFAIVNLMPKVKPRYSMPIYPLAAILSSLSLSGKSEWQIPGVLRKALRFLLLFLSFVSLISLFLFLVFRFINSALSGNEIVLLMKKASYDVGISFLLMVLSVILPIFFYFFRVEEDSLCGEIDFRFGGVLSLVLCVSLYIYSFVFPIKQQYEKARVFAKNIVELVPAKSDFYIGRGLSAEAFLFYMDRDYKITEELSPKAVEGGFLLIEEDRIEVIPENAKKIKYGKLALLLIPPEK
ncbi:MAG TPA: glycosyltransferase family 39 protein, partial [Victivallales bacterium]|nr:glycosyltransferase family 39 protein [Victivallales bacterium]